MAIKITLLVGHAVLLLEFFQTTEQGLVALWRKVERRSLLARVACQMVLAVVDTEKDGFAFRVIGTALAVEARGREVRIDRAVDARTGLCFRVSALLLPVTHEFVLLCGLDNVRQGEARSAIQKQKAHASYHQHGGSGRRNEETHEIPTSFRGSASGDGPCRAIQFGIKPRQHDSVHRSVRHVHPLECLDGFIQRVMRWFSLFTHCFSLSCSCSRFWMEPS